MFQPPLGAHHLQTQRHIRTTRWLLLTRLFHFASVSLLQRFGTCMYNGRVGTCTSVASALSSVRFSRLSTNTHMMIRSRRQDGGRDRATKKLCILHSTCYKLHIHLQVGHCGYVASEWRVDMRLSGWHACMLHRAQRDQRTESESEQPQVFFNAMPMPLSF